MKKLLLSSLVLVFANSANAAECSVVDAKDIAKMQESLICRQGPDVGSCVALGAVVGARRISGRYLEDARANKFGQIERMSYRYAYPDVYPDGSLSTDSVKKKAQAEIRRLEVAIEKNASDKLVATDVRQRLNLDFQKALKEQRAIQASVRNLEVQKGIFQMRTPILKNIDGRIIDVANTEFSDLPDDFRKAEMEKFFTRHLASLENDKFFDLIEANVAERRAILKSMTPRIVGLSKGAANLAKKGVLVAVGVGGSLAANVGLALAVYSPSTGCSSLTDKYTNSSGSDCEPQVALSPGVLEFLTLPAATQQQWLKDKKVCAFYAQLKNKILNQSIGKVTCENKSAKYQVYNSPYGAYTSTIRFREDNSIQSVRSDFGADGAVLYQVDSKGKDVSLKSEGLKEKANEVSTDSVTAAKMFAVEVANCCKSEGKTRDSCLKSYNGEAPKLLYGAESGKPATK